MRIWKKVFWCKPYRLRSAMANLYGCYMRLKSAPLSAKASLNLKTINAMETNFCHTIRLGIHSIHAFMPNDLWMLCWLDRWTEKGTQSLPANFLFVLQKIPINGWNLLLQIVLVSVHLTLESLLSSKCTIVQLHFGIVKEKRGVQFQRLKWTVLSPE